MSFIAFPQNESGDVRKPTFWFLTWSDTNRAVQLQKMARCLKFRIEEVEGLYYSCSENKGVDQRAVTMKLICVFVFAYAKCWFSHDVAQINASPYTFVKRYNISFVSSPEPKAHR